MTKTAMGVVIAALIVMNVTIAAFVVMAFSVKRIEYAIFYRPYVEAEINALQIELSNVRQECYRKDSIFMVRATKKKPILKKQAQEVR